MAIANEYVTDVPFYALTTEVLATGYHFGVQRLPAGYIYYLEDAYICPTTTVAAATTHANGWLLVDEDGNTIGTVASGAALAVGGTAFGSLSTQYREIDASSAAHSVYCTWVQSGNGVLPLGNYSIICRWSKRRPGSAA